MRSFVWVACVQSPPVTTTGCWERILCLIWHHGRISGQKKEEENYKDGKPDGLYTLWYENGQKSGEGTYKEGKLVTVVQWKFNGEKCPVTNIDEDGNGVWVLYNDDGTERFRYTYKNGERVRD